VARHAIGISILELFRRMHRVSACRARMRVAEQLLQACLWNATLDGMNGERVSRVVNRRSHNLCRFAHATPGLPCGPVRKRWVDNSRAWLSRLSVLPYSSWMLTLHVRRSMSERRRPNASLIVMPVLNSSMNSGCHSFQALLPKRGKLLVDR